MNPYIQNIDRINQQIRELENIRSGYQSMPQQQPIQNIINTNPFISQFEARFLKKDEKVEDLLVQHKTAFISPENGFLKIKDTDGEITEYKLIPPLDEKDKKIKELEERIRKYESLNKPIAKGKPRSDDPKPNEYEPED